MQYTEVRQSISKQGQVLQMQYKKEIFGIPTLHPLLQIDQLELSWTQQHASKRRSSVAVMASGVAAAQAEKDQMQQAASPTLKPQSRSAVHYLAISPPRIRVTDAQGMNSTQYSVQATSDEQKNKSCLNPEFTKEKKRSQLSIFNFEQNWTCQVICVDL